MPTSICMQILYYKDKGKILMIYSEEINDSDKSWRRLHLESHDDRSVLA